MPLAPALQQLIATKLAHTVAPQWELPLADVRASFRKLWTPAITGEPVSLARIDDVTIPGADAAIPARVYTPESVAAPPVMLYFHGGGYVKGGIDESDAFCRNLARVARHLVLSIDYRLAPEHRFPAAHDDAETATRWAAAYLGDRGDAKDPRVSPIYAADLSGLPPALIIAAEYDALRDEARAYAERLQAAGVPTRYVCQPGMVHGFLQMRGLVADAQTATEEIARALA